VPLLLLLELLELELLDDAIPPAPPAPPIPIPPSPPLLEDELDELPELELLLALVVVPGFSSMSPQAMKMPPESAAQIKPHACFFIVRVSSMLRQTKLAQLELAKKALCRERIICFDVARSGHRRHRTKARSRRGWGLPLRLVRA
jgi:hypothetical protein